MQTAFPVRNRPPHTCEGAEAKLMTRNPSLEWKEIENRAVERTTKFLANLYNIHESKGL